MADRLQFRVVRGHGDRGALILECERGCDHGRPGVTECRFALWQRPALDNNGAKIWQWDGNTDKPTISPSIDCKGGCGRHFTMKQGTPR
jgi:hypothetical protein